MIIQQYQLVKNLTLRQHTYIGVQVGVTIDNKLIFDKQIDNVTRKVSQQLEVPNHLRNIIPLEKRKNCNFFNHLLPPF